MSDLFTCQPISDWTPFGTEERWANPFRATWSDTLRLLKRELVHLDAERVVVELDLQAGQIRRDGMPRSTAKVTSPAVRLAFQSSVGPLTYATDRFYRRYSDDPQDWQINLRAIALGLEALRKVERYGVTRRGEQYAGFRALPAGRGEESSHMTDLTARLILLEHSGSTEQPEDMSGLGLARMATLWKTARRRTHPDKHDGDQTAWDAVEQAAAVLGLS